MNKRTKALQFTAKARKEIYARDGTRCLFCMIQYRMPAAWRTYLYEMSIMETMHIIPRSKGGLGIAQNGMIGCKYHHRMLDEGPRETRKEMQEIISGYMAGKYPGWNRDSLVYQKGEPNVNQKNNKGNKL